LGNAPHLTTVARESTALLSFPRKTVVGDAHAVSGVPAGLGLPEAALTAVVHTDRDLAMHALVRALFDLVAHVGTAVSTRYGRQRLAVATADLATDTRVVELIPRWKRLSLPRLQKTAYNESANA